MNEMDQNKKTNYFQFEEILNLVFFFTDFTKSLTLYENVVYHTN